MANDSGHEGVLQAPADPTDPKRLAARLEESFERRLAALTDAVGRVREESDAEAIHDLRVATRRLGAVLRVWCGLVPGEARWAAARRLRRLRRRLGKARELEVHVTLLEGRLPAHGAGPRAAAASMLLGLKGRLARRRRAAARRVSPRRARRLLRSLDRAGGGLGRRFPRDPHAVEGALAIERQAAAAALGAAREATAHPDDLRLHAARVQVKKWRYALECLDETLGGVPRGGVRALRRLQDVLGEIHDRTVLRAAIARLAPEPSGERVPDALGPLMDKLERERQRAIARFHRLAVLLDDVQVHYAWNVPPAGGPIPAPALATGTKPEAGAAAPDSGAGATPSTTGPPPAREAETAPSKDAREERWARMASWLEKSGREG